MYRSEKLGNSTFACTDGLKDHLCSSTVVKASLLIQQFLLLHFLLLFMLDRSRSRTLLSPKLSCDAHSLEMMTYFKAFNFLSILILFVMATLMIHKKAAPIKQL